LGLISQISLYYNLNVSMRQQYVFRESMFYLSWGSESENFQQNFLPRSSSAYNI